MSKITFEELMSEVEKLKKLSRKELSEEQKQFILKAYRDWETDRKSTRLNSSHSGESRMPSSA